jgi:hypothetical protein
MNKVANAEQLQSELRRILAASQRPNPSREKLAASLRELASRVASEHVASESTALTRTLLECSDTIRDTLEKKVLVTVGRSSGSKVFRPHLKPNSGLVVSVLLKLPGETEKDARDLADALLGSGSELEAADSAPDQWVATAVIKVV